MTERRTIVVGVDGSPSSAAAIRYAAEMADRFDGRLKLVHVVPWTMRTRGLCAVMPAYFEDVGRSILADAADRAEGLVGEDRVGLDLRIGTRVWSLLESATGAGAIVLGFDANPTLECLGTGSTATGVAARANIPVIVVRSGWSPEAHGVVAVGVKSIETSTGLLRRAFDAASGRAARLRIVHAWALPTGYDDAFVSPAHREAVSESAAEQLHASASGVGADYPEVEYDVVAMHGHPARVLATMSCDADLLLLERRRHPLFGPYLGGTARTLLRESECPVVVVPPDEETTTAPETRTAVAAGLA